MDKRYIGIVGSVITIKDFEGFFGWVSKVNQSMPENLLHFVKLDVIVSSEYIDLFSNFPNLRIFGESDSSFYQGYNQLLDEIEQLGLSSLPLFTLNLGDFPCFDDIQAVCQEFESRELDAVFGSVRYFKPAGKLLYRRSWRSRRPLLSVKLTGWMAPHGGVAVRSSALLGLCGYSEEYKLSADYEMIVRIYMNCRVKFRSDVYPILADPAGMSNKSYRQRLIGFREDVAILKSLGSPLPLISAVVKRVGKLHQWVVE